jgi:general secretion pathway protein K
MSKFNHKRLGGALLTALFIMTMIAIVATAMGTRLQLDIYRTRLMIQHDKLYLATQAVTFWAISELKNKENLFTKLNKNGTVSELPEKFAILTKPVQLTGGLYDLQGLYNVNNLSNKQSIPTFLKLLEKTPNNLSAADRGTITLAVLDWLSRYELGKGKDEYMAYYMTQNPPYYPGHQLFSSKSELRLVKDVGAELYNALEPFITALPEATPVNINTASKEVLSTISVNLTNSDINEMIEARGTDGIKQPNDLTKLLTKLNVRSEGVTLTSQYFLSVADAHLEDSSLKVFTYLKRTQDKRTGNITVSVLRESLNTN